MNTQPRISDASEVQALNVLSEYIKHNDGYIPCNPNELVSYSCSRFDLPTLDYAAAKTIISSYQRSADRLRSNTKAAKSARYGRSTRTKSPTSYFNCRDQSPSNSSDRRRAQSPRHKSRRITPTNLTLPKYDDITAHSDSDLDMDIDDILQDVLDQNMIKMMHSRFSVTTMANTLGTRTRTPTTMTMSSDTTTQFNHEDIIRLYIAQFNKPPKHAKDLIMFSCHRIKYAEAQRLLDAFYRNYHTKSVLQVKQKIHARQQQQQQQHVQVTDDEETNDQHRYLRRIAIIEGDEEDEEEDEGEADDTTQRHLQYMADERSSDNVILDMVHKCRKTTKVDCIVFIVWLLMMAATLFGVSFGLIHIGYGINTLKQSTKVTQEVCTVVNYTRIPCEVDANQHALYRYEYAVKSVSKCGSNETLYVRESDRQTLLASNTNECGLQYYHRSENISCFINGECDEYSLIGYPDLILTAKQDIEMGCIVLIVTTVPFITFVCWVYFCYQCGPK